MNNVSYYFLIYLLQFKELITTEMLRIGPMCLWRFWLRSNSGIKSRNSDFNSWKTLSMYIQVSHELRSLFRESVPYDKKYTDITQNTYVKSWSFTEIMAREKCWNLAFPRTVRLQLSAHWSWQSNAVFISVLHKFRPTR